MVFLARAEAAAGRKEAAAAMLITATELVRAETNFYVKAEPLLLAAETLAQWGDYAAAEREVKGLNATISPETHGFCVPYEGPRSDYFRITLSIVVRSSNGLAAAAPAQLCAPAKSTRPIKTIDRIADVPGRRTIREWYRGYFYGLVARELQRTGDSDRVQKLLATETIAAVREDDRSRTDRHAESEPPAKAATESAVQILQKVVDKHRFWLDPRPKNLRYTLTGGKPEPDDNDKMVHQVLVSGENVRWEMDANLEPPGNSPDRSLEYTTIITPEKTVWLRVPKGVKKEAMNDVSDTRRFRQGMIWQTAFHALTANGIPAKCQVVEEIESKEGRVVVVEVEFDNARASVGLGMYQLQFGAANWRMNKVRLHIRLPDYLPIREQYFDTKTGAASDTAVSFGPEFIKVGEHVAPKTMRYVQTYDEKMQRLTKFREWVLEGHFHEVQGVWLLDNATNSHDGTIVRQMQVSDVSTAPILEEKFDPLIPTE